MAVGARPWETEPKADIFATDVLALGSGWYAPESFRGVRFRWANNDAIVYVAAMSPERHRLNVLIEPGPGLGLKPFELEVFDGAGDPIAKPKVAGKQTIAIDLPASAVPKVHALRLHVEGGGLAAANDVRIMNLRVFELKLEKLSSDVLPAWVVLGRGWYPLETFRGTTFRWVSNDALLAVTASGSGTLEFDVEPGPGVDSKPFVLKLLDREGRALGEAKVATRETVTFQIPKLPAEAILHVDGGGKTVAGDPRIMNFRVFAASVRS
jgi:hypothetical protein